MKLITTLKRSVYVFLFVIFASLSFAQNKTISEKPKSEREMAATHKVLIVPFEPRMYFSEIDRSINAETKLTAKEIKYKFRDGLGEQLYKAFKASGYNCLDLMEDTTKYKKDLDGIYQYLGYDYQKVPNQQNYHPPEKERSQKNIDKGQLNVETNSDERFMNAKLSNPKALAQLNAKFKADVFVFINQLDIKASGSKDPNQMTGTESRRLVVHYTVYTLNGKEINSGTAEELFDPLLNNPKKITDKHFTRLAASIVARVNKGLAAAAAH